jgi:hypothetical protein
VRLFLGRCSGSGAIGRRIYAIQCFQWVILDPGCPSLAGGELLVGRRRARWGEAGPAEVSGLLLGGLLLEDFESPVRYGGEEDLHGPNHLGRILRA